MKKTITTIAFALFFTHVYALDVNNLTNSEASGGLKSALIQGAGKAVSKLSAVDGFFKNKDVKIPLPENLKKIDKVMRIFGMGRQADDLVLKMNRAAEEAVPEARTLLVNAIKK